MQKENTANPEKDAMMEGKKIEKMHKIRKQEERAMGEIQTKRPM